MKEIGSHPLVSIITPVHNGAPYLEDLIQSILQQDYSNIEHIVIDDGSNDGGATVAILKSSPHLRWSSRVNKGQYATINEGIREAKGEIIGIISADDIYNDNHIIRKIVETFMQNPACIFVYGKLSFIDEKGDLIAGEPLILDVNKKFPRWLMDYVCCISHAALFVRLDFVKQNQLWWDGEKRYCGDGDWIRRIVELSSKSIFLEIPVAKYRVHKNQLSIIEERQAMVEREIYFRRRKTSWYLHKIIIRIIWVWGLIQKSRIVIQMRGIRYFLKVLFVWIKRKILKNQGASKILLNEFEKNS
jgi:glycosyltransferase involved in cell wall biosynthesis